jgi:nanoRNase/pAp phosphatase (c-di-AMP/oligoRNAs hydrolase)
MINMDYIQFRDECLNLVAGADSVVITSHMSPDDDSIGSVLSVYTILTEAFPQKNIRIIYTGEMVFRYSVFANFEKIHWVDDVANHLEGVDLLVMLDASQYARFSKLPEKLALVPHKICIDHHASEPDAFTLLLKVQEVTSNSELIYRTFVGEVLPVSVAEPILLGILGDTGNFSYVPPAQADVFLIAKRLIETIGTPIDQFRARYGGIPKRIIPLLQDLVKNTTYGTVTGWPDFQYSYIDRATLEGNNYTDEDMSAASHIYMGQYLPRVQGYGWGFVITPRQSGGCRMSGRSLPGSVNVRDLHERLGIGSGHDRASGGYFPEPDPQACIKLVHTWINENAPVLK